MVRPIAVLSCKPCWSGDNDHASNKDFDLPSSKESSACVVYDPSIMAYQSYERPKRLHSTYLPLL